MEFDGNYAEGPVFLRLERVGNQVTASSSPDGKSWQRIASHPFDTMKVRVGVAAINTSSRPLVASFAQFQLMGP